MDPQQRVFLETAWAAVENAGYAGRYEGLIGVYAGMGNNTYYRNNLLCHPERIRLVGDITVEIGTEKDHIAPRLSYLMDFRGPSLSIHTACSTTLVVVDSAFHALLTHQCDLAIAGGVDITVPQKSGQYYQEGGIFTKDGHCRPFDADATGTMFGDAVGAVVLKRVDEAIRDGDTIYAVILGSAVNHDGANKVNYLAPSVDQQAEVIALAQAKAGVHPDSIGYIEAHGTATPIGNPIEVAGLTKAFRLKTNRTGFCALGSLKGNCGHGTTAAGICGLIKAALVVRHGVIPPTINFSKPNPHIDFRNSPFFVNTSIYKWPEKARPRRAGVSSFGYCGTNAHAVLQEPPESESDVKPVIPWQLLTFSAKTDAALERSVKGLREHLAKNPAISLADAAWTLQVGRRTFPHRAFFVASAVEDALQAMENRGPNRYGRRTVKSGSPDVVFLFPGQGSQYVGMGKNLYQQDQLFRGTVDRCAGNFDSAPGTRHTRAPLPGARRQGDCRTFAERNVLYATGHFHHGICPGFALGSLGNPSSFDDRSQHRGVGMRHACRRVFA